MTPPHPRPAVRATAPAILTLAALAALSVAPHARADTPVVDVQAQFGATLIGGGSVVPDQGPDYAAVRSTPVTGVVAGHWGQQLYCNPYGAGTAIVGFQYLLGRWHASAGDGVIVQENTDAGTIAVHSDASLVQGSARGAGPWAGAAAAMSPTQCVGVQVVARTTRSGSYAWTVDLQRVAILDGIGPSVGSPAVGVAWVTGASAPVAWDQSDNGFARGTTSARIVGGGSVDLGDPPNGRVSAQIPVGGLPDGVHTVQVARSAPGWSTRTAEVGLAIDRTPPPVPDLTVADEGWTNAAAVGVAAPAVTDATSGWSRNEFQVDGGPWTDLGTAWSMRTPGAHTVRVRAVDRAGLVSGPSGARQVRIDRTAPVVRTLDVDAAGPGGPTVRLTASDAGGAGLGECTASMTLERPDGSSVPILEVAGRALAGTGEVAIPVRQMTAGGHVVRLAVCDEAGNRTTRAAAFTWTPPEAPAPRTVTPAPAAGGATPGPAVTTGRPARPTRTARVTTTSPGGRLLLVRPLAVVTATGRVALSGRLFVDGRPLAAGRRVVLRDAAGRVTVRAVTRTGGLVVLRGRARRSAVWTLTVAGKPALVVRVRITVTGGGR